MKITFRAIPDDTTKQSLTAAKSKFGPMLANGCFGSVHAHPQAGCIIKIGTHAPRFGGDLNPIRDDGYLNFLQENSKRPSCYAPVVSDLIVFEEPTTRQGFYIARMEKLEKRFSDYDDRTRARLYGVFGKGVTNGWDIENEIPTMQASNDKNLRNIGKTLEIVFARWGNDLHNGNLMTRRTPQGLVPVIIDPVAWLR